MTKTNRLAAIWDHAENGWYFRADNHEGYFLDNIADPHETDEILDAAARRYARYCGVPQNGLVEVIR